MIKNIILTSADLKNTSKAILSLEKDSGLTRVVIKGFNFPQNSLKKFLGIKTSSGFYKIELKNENEFLIDNDKINFNDKISAVIIEITEKKPQILMWGSNETTRVWQNSIMSNFSDETSENETETSEVLTQNIDNEIQDYETDEEIEKIIDKSLNDNEFEEIGDFKEKPQEEFNNKSDFLFSIEEQINELLNNYEEEKALEELIPNSKFVKVNSKSSDDNFYIFGVIYENNEIRYIVYGIPGEYAVKPDDEYAQYYQFLPLSNENPEGFGYYLMYQDAINGNQVEIIYD